MSETIGILLLNLGGPPDQAAVEPFLQRLFSDREIIQLPGGDTGQKILARLIARARGAQVRANYRSIGGGSPILPLTRRQAEALEQELNRPAPGDARRRVAAPGGRSEAAAAPETRFRVGIAMRYWHPTSEEALRDMLAAGVRRIVALTLYPQYSAATTGSSWNELRRALSRLESGGEAASAREEARAPAATAVGAELTLIDRYAEHPKYLSAVADTVEEALAGLSAPERASAVLLFSAHGLPIRFIRGGDPYEREIHATREGVLRHLRQRGIENPWRLGYQSRTGPVRWLGPSTDAVIEEAARDGVRTLVVVPIAFVSDHIETLYEIDQLFAATAAKAGIVRFVRTRMLDDRPGFIECLADLVREHLGSRP